MGKRLNRTVRNPRWWLLLPTWPLILTVATAALLFRYAASALDVAQDACLEFLAWARKEQTP